MKKILSTAICMALFTLSFAAAQVDPYVFYDGKLTDMQARAKAANRPYFIYLYANWSMQAKEMEEKMFRNQELVQFAKNNYIGMRVDGEALINEGAQIAKAYKVLYFPTVIFFTPQGKELDRLYGNASAADFLAKMQKYRSTQGEPDAKTVIQKEDSVSKEGEWLFKMSARRQPAEGFGVQVGVFGTYRNAFAKLLELEEVKFHKNILVYVKDSGKLNDKPQYRVILGPFVSKEQAEAYRILIEKKEKEKGMVVDLSTLE